MIFNTKSNVIYFAWFWCCLFISFSSLAQSDHTGKRRVSSTYAIKNTTVFSAPGQSKTNVTLLVKDGLIHQIGTNVNIPAEAQEIEGDSLFVYAGFIDPAGDMGVSKPSDPDRPQDFDSSNPPDEIAGITPYRSVLDQFDPNSSKIDEWRKMGFTIVQLIPDGGMLPGKAAILVMGDPKNTNLLMPNTALIAKFSGSRGMYPGTTLGVMSKFREIYKNAELSSQHESLFASTAGLKRPSKNKTYEALYPALDKNIPFIFEVGGDLEMRRALKLQKEHGFNLILAGVSEGEEVIPVIKSANAGILFSMKLPEDKASKAKAEESAEEQTARIDRVKASYEKSLKQAAAFEKAGIPFAFHTKGGKSGDMMKNIRLMIENGLSETGALAALTTNGAKILGIEKMAGTVENGKLANLVILTDTLFKEDAQIRYVLADGYLHEYEVKTKKNGKTENGEEKVNVEGKWNYTSSTPAGSSEGEMIIKKDGSAFSGTITLDDPTGSGKLSPDMKNIQVSGSRLSFAFELNIQGSSITVEVSGDVDGDSFSGNMSVAAIGSFPLEATKVPDSTFKF